MHIPRLNFPHHALFFLSIPITSVTSPPISPLNFSTLTAVGRSQLLARWPGTHSRISSWIQRAAQTVVGVYLKRTCSRVTSASSALGVLNDYALYKSKHSVTHSLLPYLVQSYQYMQQEMKDCVIKMTAGILLSILENNNLPDLYSGTL